jgi:hypothetical protein
MTENIDIDEEWDKEFHPKEEEEKQPIPKVTKQDIEFVIDTMAKEAKHDRTSIKQIFHGFNTGLTKTVLHGNLNSKNAGSGKSYLLNLVASYYPTKYLLILQGASDKAFQHAPGAMVLEDKETGELTPTEPITNQLDSDIADLEQKLEDEKSKEKKDKSLIKQLKEQISDKETEIKAILNKQVKLIILSDCITLFLDTPQDAVTDNLMSILSNDTDRDQKYLFADKNASGKIAAKYNILRGTPVVFTTRVIDDTATRRFEEKNRRFVNITPNVSEQKIGDANNLMWEECALTAEEYDESVVSREDKEKCRKIISTLVEKLKDHSKYLGPKQFGIKIPFLYSIKIPTNDVWSMTVTDRMRRYLTIITKENMDSRPRLVRKDNPNIFLPISTFEDFKETLELMKIGSSNIRPYIVEWYNDVFLVAFKEENGIIKEKEVDGRILKENYVSVTSSQLVEKTLEIKKISISNLDLRHKYIDPLINQGLIDKQRSEIRKSENIYYTVNAKGDNIFSLFGTEESKLAITKPELYPSRKIIQDSFEFKFRFAAFCQNEREKAAEKSGEEEAGIFSKKLLDIYRLEDENGAEISLDELVDRYFTDPGPDTCFIKNFEELKNEKK